MKCFYHNDLDGHCAGYIVKSYLETIGQRVNVDDFIESDYNTRSVDSTTCKDGEDVYIVDYSFSEQTFDVLLDLINRCNVTWIDHHDSSISLIKNHSNILNPYKIDLWVNKRGSGAYLAYDFLFHKQLQFNPVVPKYIQLVSDYDTWNNTQESIRFKLGMDSVPNNVFDNVWDQLDKDKHIIQSIIDAGKYIESYIDATNSEYLNSYGYVCNFKNYTFCVVNKKSNSWIFGDRIAEYDACITYVFNGSKYIYSIFSASPDFNCAEFAEQYGGGGHASAAGFTSETLLFVEN